MIPMHTVFIMLVTVFVFIGSLRGWAKEILAAISVILALFIEAVLTTLVPAIRDLWANMAPMSQLWIRLPVFVLLVIFGYASPPLAQRFGASVARERLQDMLLGFFLGLLNGFLIIGTLWFYVDEAHYGVPDEAWHLEEAMVHAVDDMGQPLYDAEGRPVMDVVRDDDGNVVMEVVYDEEAKGLGGIRPPGRDTTGWKLIAYLPPRLIVGPSLYVAVALSFVFVIIVFV